MLNRSQFLCVHTTHHPSPFVPADFEYECAWQGLASIKFNRWITRAELVEKGFRKFVTEFDQRLAASALGNDARPLSKETITKFLQDFGLDPEFGVHSNIRGLSGGCTCWKPAALCGWCRVPSTCCVAWCVSQAQALAASTGWTGG
jgi:hypothetical protein